MDGGGDTGEDSKEGKGRKGAKIEKTCRHRSFGGIVSKGGYLNEEQVDEKALCFDHIIGGGGAYTRSRRQL